MPVRRPRLRLREALQRDRSKTRARGHDWDVADVMAVVNESDYEFTGTEAGEERLAALATGSALRRAATRSIRALAKLTGLNRAQAKVVHDVIRDLDVPDAGEALPPQPNSHRREVRDRGQHHNDQPEDE